MLLYVLKIVQKSLLPILCYLLASWMKFRFEFALKKLYISKQVVTVEIVSNDDGYDIKQKMN